MITWTKRLLLTVSFLALITANILTLTSTAFNAAVSGLMGTALGIRTVSSMMQTKLTTQDKAIKKQTAVQANRKAATRRFGNRLASRTKRVAAKSIAAIPAESTPFIGVAVLIADTGYELYATDLETKLRDYQCYCNKYSWEKHYRGLLELPIAA
jgi:hypothetical protein